MKKCAIYFCIILSLFLFVGRVEALIIDFDSYTRDTESGLDWLDFSYTIHRSYNNVSDNFNSGGEFEGYRYASAQEVVELWSHFGIGPFNSSSYQGMENYWVLNIQSLDAVYDFHNLLGTTGASGGRPMTQGITSDLRTSNTGVILRNIAGTQTIYQNNVLKGAVASVNSGIDDATPSYWTASYLVKDISQSVPEPTSLMLFGAGFIGLLRLRGKA